MTRALVAALAAVALRFSREDRAEKLRLLSALARRPIREATSLARLHESLCFLQAYPDDPEVLRHVEQALAGFPPRVARLAPSARARLHDSGIAGTTLDYPFGLPMARWLVSRAPADVEVAWARFEGGERLEEALSLLVTKAEEDAFTEGGFGWRRWLRLARGDRRRSDLQVLVDLFERARLPKEARDWLFESVELPVVWRLRAPALSRTGTKLPWARPFFHPAGPRRKAVRFGREVKRPLTGIERAPIRQAHALIDAARIAMATRQRELYCFSYPNPGDVWVAEPGGGLCIALFGIRPELRQPFEGYYAFLALKNGVPVSYGGGWTLFDTLDFALNVFPSFRQGESVFLMSQVLRAYRHLLGRRRFAVDAYQLGRGNEEALRTGAFYFYSRAGFRPGDRERRRLLARERERIGRDRSYRSPPSVLLQLARDEVCLNLDRGTVGERRVRASQLAALVTSYVARQFAGDRSAALREAAARVARALGAERWRRWRSAERLAFERWSLVAVQIPGLGGWPAVDRRLLLDLVRAKGGESEVGYLRLLARHRRLHEALADLVRSLP